jgi:hypothetical protein
MCSNFKISALLVTWLFVFSPNTLLGQSTSGGVTYKVVGVPLGDHLNLRDAPNPQGTLVDKIPRDAENIVGTGRAVRVGGQQWYEVTYAGNTGWVSARYLQASGKIATDAHTENVSPRRIAESCEAKKDNMQQPICEAASHAPRFGKRIPEDRMFFDGMETFEPDQYCFQLIVPKRSKCFHDEAGNETCAIAVEEVYECGASGGNMLVYKCVKSRKDGRVFRRIDNVSDELGSGIADLIKMRTAMGDARVHVTFRS